MTEDVVRAFATGFPAATHAVQEVVVDGDRAAVTRTMFVDTVDRQVAETIVGYLQASDAAMRVAQLRVLGGAMTRVPADAHRLRPSSQPDHGQPGRLLRRPGGPSGAPGLGRRVCAALRQRDDGAYMGFLGEDSLADARRAYPRGTWERLVQVKARYDPTNLVHHNHNIPPRIKEPGQ